MKRSSAEAGSGQRFKTVVELLAMVAARVEPAARMRIARVLKIGLEWGFGQSPTGPIGTTWKNSTSTNLFALSWNSVKRQVPTFYSSLVNRDFV